MDTFDNLPAVKDFCLYRDDDFFLTIGVNYTANRQRVPLTLVEQVTFILLTRQDDDDEDKIATVPTVLDTAKNTITLTEWGSVPPEGCFYRCSLIYFGEIKETVLIGKITRES